MDGIQGKNALVTGASTGIGSAIAQKLAALGANVVVNYHSSSEAAEQTRQQMLDRCQGMETCGIKAIAIQADVSKEDEVDRLFAETLAAFGSIDILVNNAGIQTQGASHDIEISAFDKMLDVNLRGAYLCSRKALQHFLDRSIPGVILNVSSVHEDIPRPGYLGYAISKGGMESMTQTLALEYARLGIRVNAIGPGATATPINTWIDDAEIKSEVEDFIPMGRIGKPEEMADAAAFLISDSAAYITGQTLFIDGGLTLYPGFRKPKT